MTITPLQKITTYSSSPSSSTDEGKRTVLHKEKKEKEKKEENILLLEAQKLPGSFCLKHLENKGLTTCLNTSTAFLNSFSRSLHGRSTIAQKIIPQNTSACGRLAAWVWCSGTLPEHVDVISHSHHRTSLFDRKIVVHKRNVPDTHQHKVGNLPLTSPLWTICEIASLCRTEFRKWGDLKNLLLFLHTHGLTIEDCMNLLHFHPRWPGKNTALGRFKKLLRDPRSIILLPLS